MILEINQHLQYLPDSIMAAILIVIAVLDIKYMLIFNTITYPLMLAGIVLNSINGNISSIFWLVLCGVIMFLISYAYNGGLGGGDIKLSMAVGAWLGDERSILAIIIAFLSGGVYAMLVIVAKRNVYKNMKIPFAPFIAIGGILSLIEGYGIWIWYINILLGQ